MRNLKSLPLLPDKILHAPSCITSGKIFKLLFFLCIMFMYVSYNLNVWHFDIWYYSPMPFSFLCQLYASVGVVLCVQCIVCMVNLPLLKYWLQCCLWSGRNKSPSTFILVYLNSSFRWCKYFFSEKSHSQFFHYALCFVIMKCFWNSISLQLSHLL